ALAKEMGLDKNSAHHRVRKAIERGYLVNREDKRGMPARIALADPLPEEIVILPDPEVLECCSVGVMTEGETKQKRPRKVENPSLNSPPLSSPPIHPPTLQHPRAAATVSGGRPVSVGTRLAISCPSPRPRCGSPSALGPEWLEPGHRASALDGQLSLGSFGTK